MKDRKALFIFYLHLHMRLKYTHIIALLSLICSQGLAQDTTMVEAPTMNQFNLGINLEVGDTYILNHTYQEKITQTILGARLEGSRNISTSLRLEVSDIQDQEINLITTFEKISIEDETGVDSLDYDSEYDSSGVLPSLNALIEQSFLLTINKQGEILHSESLQDLFQTLESEASTSIFGYQFVQSILSNALNIYGSQAVELGQTWEVPGEIIVSKDLVLPNTPQYTMESLSEDLIWLNVGAQDHQSIQGNYEINRFTGLISYGTAHYELQDDPKIEIDIRIEINKQLN